MDLVRCRWAWGMLDALETPAHRTLVKKHLPRIVPQEEPIGPLAANLALEAGMNPDQRPLVFPTSDDQQAGLVGGGAVDAGHMAVILGNSAVVNSSSDDRPAWQQPRRDAAQLGSVPVDAMLQQRGAVPRQSRRRKARLETAGSGRRQDSRRLRRRVGHALSAPRAVAQGVRASRDMVGEGAAGHRRALPGFARGVGLPDCPRRARAREGGPADQPHQRFRRHCPQRADVPDPGQRLRPPLGAAQVRRRARRSERP